MTAGHDFDTTCYPDFLAQMLDLTKYEVSNFGSAGTTACYESDNPYLKANYTKAMDSKPDIVILMFGTNDARSQSWNLN